MNKYNCPICGMPTYQPEDTTANITPLCKGHSGVSPTQIIVGYTAGIKPDGTWTYYSNDYVANLEKERDRLKADLEEMTTKYEDDLELLSKERDKLKADLENVERYHTDGECFQANYIDRILAERDEARRWARVFYWQWKKLSDIIKNNPL